MNVLYLYSEVMGYNLPIFDQLANHYGASVAVIHWNNKKLTPFKPTALNGVVFHDRSNFTSSSEMIEFADKFNPNIVYISGWQDKGYLPVVQHLKRKNIPIVMGLDSQWNGTLRQQAGAQLIRNIYKNRYFSYAWVPGPMQYEFASRIGFASNEIITNLLSCNSDLFSQAYADLNGSKAVSYPKKFIFVGRFSPHKGIDILIDAFRIYRNEYRGDWELACFGNGPLDGLLSKHPEITTYPFLSQAELINHAKSAGAFILPSRYEPWGVAVHEFATAGLPLILSDRVGARSQFLIEGFNGYAFCADSAQNLALKMHTLAQNEEHELIEMGRRSNRLAQHITPEITSASLMSVLNRNF